MKKRFISLALTAATLLSMIPAVGAAEAKDTQKNTFMLPVAAELPQKQSSGLMIDNDKIALPAVDGADFVADLSGEMPTIREDGFLAEPTAPLKAFPETGKLLSEVGDADETATPIATAAELAAITSDGNYVLTADIDLTGANWTPINEVSNVTLDGQGHVISGMTIDGTHWAGGLFGQAENTTIRNLVVCAPTFLNARIHAGTLIGYAEGNTTIENCTVEQLTTKAASYFAGLIGTHSDRNKEATITLRDCAVDISLADSYASGALISSADTKSVSFTDCLVKVKFSGGGSGLASSITCAEAFSMLRCAVYGEITNASLSVAGMINRLNAPSCRITDCVFDGTISAPVENTSYNRLSGGGFFGTLFSSNAVFTNCRASGFLQDMVANAFGGIGSFVGSGPSSVTFSHCLSDMDISVSLDESDSRAAYIGGLMGISPKSFYAVDCLNTGDLTAIATENNPCPFGGLLGEATDPTCVQFLRCENRGNITSQASAGGFVPSGSGFIFKDCKNTGSISASDNTGGMVGNGSGTFSNCVNTGKLTGSCVGGLVGRGDKSTFYDCRTNFNAVPVSSSSVYYGGMVGYGNACEYNDCAVNMTATLPAPMESGTIPASYIGGLSSRGGGTAERCAVKLRLNGTQASTLYIGGMFAWVDSAVDISDSIVDLSFSGITSTSSFCTGGLVSYASTNSMSVDNCAVKFDVETPSSSIAYAGGILGYSYGIAQIRNTYATGSIDMRPDVYGAAQGNAGGLIGNMGSGSPLLSIEGCWTDVDISGANAMGGLVGSSYNTTAIISSSWADGTLSLKDVIPLLTEEATVASSYLGGLVGYNNSSKTTGASSNMVIQDCYFDGQIECADAQYTGGIIGQGGSLIYNCYSTEDLAATIDPGDLDRTRYIGGLAGGTGTVSYCRYDGSITVPCSQKASNGHDAAGGIAGYGTAQNCQSTAAVRGYKAGGVLGSGDAFNCDFNGSVIGVDYAGGITGSGGAENCTSSGYVQGCTVGGIAGSAGGDIIGCTSDCALYLHSACTETEHYIGGIAGRTTSYDIYDSHYERHLQVTFTEPTGYDSTYLFVGGIVGDASSVNLAFFVISGCTSKGVTVYSHGVRELAIGGIAGEITPGTIHNCRVDGNVYVRGWGNGTSSSRLYECLYAGGLFGYGGDVSIANCIVNGDISTDFVPSDQYKKYAAIQDGRFGGYANELTVENCQFNGLFTPGPKLPSDDYASTSASIIGRCAFVTYADVPDVNSPDKPVEGYQVKVLSFNLDNTLTPMEGITVYANGSSVGTTDAEGQVTFDSDKFSSYALVWLSAEAEGYFESRHCTFLADGGTYTLVLQEKQPGVIYFKSAVMSGEEIGTADLLSYLTDLKIDVLDTTSYPLTVEIDWNDLDEEGRSAVLVNEDGTHMIHLLDGEKTVSVTLPNTFDVGEKIYLRASGYKDGEKITKEEELSVTVITTDVSFETEEGDMDVGGSGDKDDDKHLYFLKGLKFGVNFDDLADFASSISYKNGTLTVKYDFNDKQKKPISIWSGFSESVSVGGEAKIPISNLDEGEWSGKVTVKVGEQIKTDVSNKSIRKENEKHLKKDEFDKATHTYDFIIAGVPCFLETGLSVGGSASFGIHGPKGETYVDGNISANGGGSIFAGLGGEVVEDVEFKIGGEGKLDVKLPMKFDTANESAFSLDPTLSGDVNAKISAKAFIFDLEEELRLGGFLWNKNGAEWTWLDEEPNPGEDDTIGGGGGGGGSAGGRSAYSLRRSAPSYAWVAMNRNYLAEGGGFLTHDASSFAFNTASNQNLRYENIAELTEVAMATENGQTVLYFTADDGSAAGGDITTHTVLYRTVQQADGSWSEPAAVSSTSDGYPASPYADGSYVVWTESTKVDTLDNMLQSTRIRVAQNGQIVHTIETEGYVYAPKVAVSTDGTDVLVCWLSDPEVSSENLLGGNAKLFYVSCFDGTWSAAKQMTTTGVPLNASPMCGSSNSSSYIYYVNTAGNFAYRSLSNRETSLTSLPTGRTVLYKNLAAVFTEDNTLTIYRGSGSAAVKTVGYNGTAAPAFACDGSNYALFWPEAGGIRFMTSNGGYSWSDPILLTGMESASTELCAALSGGTPITAYTQNIDGQTHLFTAGMAADGIDLVLSELEYDPRDMLERDYIIFNGTLFNNSLSQADGFTVTVTDETGAQIFTRTYTTDIPSGGTANFSAAFAPDGLSEHTYTFTVTPVSSADADASDNTLDISVGQPSAQIVDANFLSTPDGSVQLSAMVRNTGASLLNGATVKITTAGGETVLSQSYRGEEAIPYGSIRQLLVDNAQANTYYEVSVLYDGEVLDSTMLMYEDPNAKLLLPTDVSVDGDAAQITLLGQNQTASSGKVILAVYDGARMAAVGARIVSDLNGRQDLEFSLSDVLSAGEYTYKLFFLSNDEGYSPIAPAVSGTINVD